MALSSLSTLAPVTTPAGANLVLTQGVPYAQEFRFVGAAAVWPGAEGCQALAQVRERVTDSTVMLDLTPDLVVSVDGDDVLVTLTLTGAQTRTLSANGFYDLYLTDSDGSATHAVRVAGRVLITLAVTRE
jgi:hypothetical protein